MLPMPSAPTNRSENGPGHAPVDATNYGPNPAGATPSPDPDASHYDPASTPDADAAKFATPPTGEADATWFVDTPTPPGHPHRAPASPSFSHRVRRVGNYELLQELGRGGMGVVYKAQQAGLNRLVALKMILADVHAGPEELARFRLEAEAVARLQHPHIVQIHEVGEADGRPFFSLEFVEGGSLAAKLHGTPQPARFAARLIETLARAIHFAHERGIIHRDLKPANVLLAADGTPKITDFGLAKRLDNASAQTRSGEVMGTPCYMAPEQAEGRLKDIGASSDIYALAAILYELLTGRPPFNGATAWDTIEQVRTQEPVPPSRLQLNVPRDLETICLKGLRKDPRQRFATSLELAEDLQRYLEGVPIRARPVPAWERGLKWARRRPAQAALVGTAVLALLFGSTGAVLYGWYKEERAATLEQQAVALSRLVEGQRKVDQSWTLGRQDEEAGHLSAAREHYLQALVTIDNDPETATLDLRSRIEARLQRVDQLLAEATARQGLLADQRKFQDRLQGFGRHRDQVLFHSLSLRDQDQAGDVALVRQEASAALNELGLSAEKGPDELTARLESSRRLVESPRQLTQLAAECCQVLLAWSDAEATALPAQDVPERAARLRRALRLLDAAAALAVAHGLAVPRVAHLRRAACLKLLGDERAAREAEDRAAKSSVQSAPDHFLAALDSYRKQQLEPATASCEETLQQDPNHFWAQYLKALCNMKARRWGEAKVGFTACLARNKDFLWPLQLRGMARVELKEWSAAESDFERALATTEDPAFRAAVLLSRSVLRIRQGRLSDAEKDVGQAIKLRPEAYQGYTILAKAYEDKGDLAAAVKSLDQAISLRPDVPALYDTRARYHATRGDAKAAQRDFEQVVARGGPRKRSDQLEKAHVELAHLRFLAKEYKPALAECDAALRLNPNYAPAHRQRAEALIKLDKYAEAGKALDRYLAVEHSALAWQARGLIHFELSENAAAVQAFTQSLLLKQDVETLSQRGWAYLAQDAARPALADFEAALGRNLRHTDSLCGRGMARVLIGQAVQATEDAEESLRQGPRKLQLSFNCARIYARAAGVMESSRDRTAAAKVVRYQERAVDLLRDTLRQMPKREIPAFWRDKVLRDSALAPIRRSAAMRELAGLYARQ
jgi:tetratricopeptide (TPR) repeat protein